MSEEVVLAARRGDEEAVLVWLDGGGRVNAKFEYVFSDGTASGMTLLLLAVTYGHEVLAEVLLQRGADVSLPSSDGDTALSLAAAYGSEKLVELALQHGAEIDRRGGSTSSTALMVVARQGHPSVARQLLGAGANAKIRNVDGKTALQFAKEKGHTECVRGLR